LRLLHNGKYSIQNSVEFSMNLGVPKSDVAVSLALKKIRPLEIMSPDSLVGVLAAVQLDDQADLVTCKVSEIFPDRDLAPEMSTLYRNTPEVAPKFRLRVCGACAKPTAVGDLETVKRRWLFWHA